MEAIANWFIEFFKRFSTPSPKFFKVLLVVGAISTFLGFVPDLLSFLDIAIPGEWQPWAEKILKIAGVTTMIISKLTTQSKIVKIDGSVLKKTNAKALPFTAEAEKEKAETTTK